MYYLNILDLLNDLLAVPPAKSYPQNSSQPRNPSYYPTIDQIPISRVTYSGNKTIVWFTDGTKTTVTCSPNDKYDRQTAITYALVKRLFGKLGRYDKTTKKYYANEIDSNGLGLKLEKIAKAGYDQDLEKKNLKAKKAEAKARHEATQKAQHDAAWAKKVKAKAEQIQLQRDAEKYLADNLAKTNRKILNEDKNNEYSPNRIAEEVFDDTKPINNWKNYQKPDKRFREFTQQEKRDYWNYHNALRRSKK